MSLIQGSMESDKVSGMLGAIKFDGKNFGIWKMKIKAYFEMIGLWCVLEKRTTPESVTIGLSATSAASSSGDSSSISAVKLTSKEEKEMKEKSMKA